jgi:hypothetical protein
MYKIIKIENSPRKNKRFRITLNNGDHYDFGLLGASTYLEHKDKIKRENYRKRHLGNDRENYLIKNLIPSPSLFSYYILWGDSTNINDNIKTLNSRLK